MWLRHRSPCAPNWLGSSRQQKELRRLVDDLDQPDATLKLPSPEIDLSTVRYKAHRVRNRFFRPGKGQRMLLDIFR